MAAAKRKTKRKKKRPLRREIWGAVLGVAALCDLAGMFRYQALLVDEIGVVFRGLLGSGYFLTPPALLTAAWVLLSHRGRPVAGRTASALFAPVALSALLHVFLFPYVRWEGGLTASLRRFWETGQTLSSGGVLGGGLASSAVAVLSAPVAGVVFFLALSALILHALGLSVRGLIRAFRNRPRYEYEPAPLPERKPPVRTRPVRRRGLILRDAAERPDRISPAEIDIALDDNPPEPDKPENGGRKREAKPGRIRKQDAAHEVAAQSEAVAREIARNSPVEDAYIRPELNLLTANTSRASADMAAELRRRAQFLADALHNFGVDVPEGRGIEAVCGPAVTRYDFPLERGVKLSKIINLSDDIALSLGSTGVRIAPIPGKRSVVGIEVPNPQVTPVLIRDVVETPEFRNHPSTTAFALGKDIGGKIIVGNVEQLPHVLIAGTTGSGKSVCMNCLIISLLYKSSPEQVRFIMVDPKMVELAPYNGIPHLLIPVVTDPRKAAGALQWAVGEMMKRYKTFSLNGVKNLEEYNTLAAEGTGETLPALPRVVVVIDELADLMLVAAKEVEESIMRVAQMGRAAGIHLVIATQRPSADVITGLMKANIPSRIAFAVASSIESRIILDVSGAEKLVGRGDMLYAPLGEGRIRVQGCYISPGEIDQVVSFVKRAGQVSYDDGVMTAIENSIQADKPREKEKEKERKKQPEPVEEMDELLPAAVDIVIESGQASVSMLQRRLKLGYSRAARLVDQMERRGYVGPFEGSRPRQLLITPEQWRELKKGVSTGKA